MINFQSVVYVYKIATAKKEEAEKDRIKHQWTISLGAVKSLFANLFFQTAFNERDASRIPFGVSLWKFSLQGEMETKGTNFRNEDCLTLNNQYLRTMSD